MSIRILKLIVLVFTFTFLSCKPESNDKHIETIKKNHQSVENLWNDFLKDNPNNKRKETPLSFYFCDNKKDADECAELVVKGIKKATATSLWWFEKQLPLSDALLLLHRPPNDVDISALEQGTHPAQQRLVFEELEYPIRFHLAATWAVLKQTVY